MTEERLVEVVAAVTRETGYAPTVDELAAIFGVRRVTSHGAWRRLTRAGRIGYDADGRVALR